MAAEVFGDFLIQFLKVFFAHAVAEQIAVKKRYRIFLLLQFGEFRWGSRVNTGWDYAEWKARPVLLSDCHNLVVNGLDCGLISDRHSLKAGAVIVTERITMGQNMPEMRLGWGGWWADSASSASFL